MPWWAWAWPLLGWLVLFASPVVDGWPFTIFAGVVLLLTVFAAVYHAEIVAHRVGEPFGTLVLAVAVTVIEVALIVSVMSDGGPEKAVLARDTVFAAVMIVCNGIVGLCLLVGAARYHEQTFRLQSAQAAMGVLAALTVLSLIIPNVTTTTPGPSLSQPQLIFSGVASLILYGAFVFVQTVRHRDYFLPVAGDEESHAPPPPRRAAIVSLAVLVIALIAVVLLAKALSPYLEFGVDYLGAPKTVVGIVIAGLVLLPEGLASLNAARHDRLQTSINLALGSVLASIGLTIPAVAAVSVLYGWPIVLGLDPTESVLLALTLLVSMITLATGRTTVLQGIVHLVLFAEFLFLAVVP